MNEGIGWSISNDPTSRFYNFFGKANRSNSVGTREQRSQISLSGADVALHHRAAFSPQCLRQKLGGVVFNCLNWFTGTFVC
jgi:hypothetical protein